MSKVPDKDVADTVLIPAPHPAGHVVVDSRGRNVWRWARDVIESTSVVLKRLENKDLALEPTQKVPVVGGKAAADKGAAVARRDERPAKPSAIRHPALKPGAPRRDAGGGFDPYNKG